LYYYYVLKFYFDSDKLTVDRMGGDYKENRPYMLYVKLTWRH